MKISSKEFRVRKGDQVNLRKWFTNVKPTYKSKEQYHKLLGEHVALLSAQQQVLYASNRYAVLLIFQAMDNRWRREGVRCLSAALRLALRAASLVKKLLRGVFGVLHISEVCYIYPRTTPACPAYPRVAALVGPEY